jgi:hypothetical protein
MATRFVFLLTLLIAAPAAAQTAQSEIDRFVDFYGAEVTRSGEKPDHTSTRESRILFLQRTVKAFCSPLIAMKRASDTRPISDEVVVFVGLGPEYRVFADFIPNGGSAGWSLSKHLDGRLPLDQPLVDPLTLGRLAEASFAPTVPGCKPQTPKPIPTPEPIAKPYPGDAFFVEKVGALLEADYAEAGQSLNAGSATWFARPIWTYVNEGLSIDQAVAKARKEWRAALGLPK